MTLMQALQLYRKLPHSAALARLAVQRVVEYTVSYALAWLALGQVAVVDRDATLKGYSAEVGVYTTHGAIIAQVPQWTCSNSYDLLLLV
jgi:hypothetical protein